MSGGHGRNYDDYRIVPEGGGKPVKHARTSDIAKVLDDRTLIEKWGKRMVALGLAARPDLYALVSTTTAKEKGKLNDLCANAVEAAAASSRANLGTALHTLTEAFDRGESPTVPQMLAADLAAYRNAIAHHGIVIHPEHVERVCVCADLAEPVAGTADRFVEWRGEWYVLDLKTGETLDYSWRAIAIQLAVYANASTLYDRETDKHSAPPPVRGDKAIVVHLPAGKGKCDLYLVDIAAGWEAATLSVEARAWRKKRGLAERIESDEAAA